MSDVKLYAIWRSRNLTAAVRDWSNCICCSKTSTSGTTKLRGVYRDRNAHHAIVYRIGKTRISFVEMKKGKLVTRSLPDLKFFTIRQFERVEYPLQRAVENFLKHSGGVSDAARRALVTVMKAAT